MPTLRVGGKNDLNNIKQIHIGDSTACGRAALSGQIHVDELPALQKLVVNANEISDIIGFSSNTTLTSINVFNNSLSGSLACDYKLNNQELVCFARNDLKGPFYESYPDSLCNLNVCVNANLSGTIPSSMNNVLRFQTTGNRLLSGYVQDIAKCTQWFNIATRGASKDLTHQNVLTAAGIMQNAIGNGDLIVYSTRYVDLTGRINNTGNPIDFHALSSITKFKIGNRECVQSGGTVNPGGGNYPTANQTRGSSHLCYGNNAACANRIPYFPLYSATKGAQNLIEVDIVGFSRPRANWRGGPRPGGSKFGVCGNIGIQGDPLSGHKWTSGPRLTNIDFSFNRMNGIQVLNILSGVNYAASRCNLTNGILNLCGNFAPYKFDCRSQSCPGNVFCLQGTCVSSDFFNLKCNLGWTICMTSGNAYWGAISCSCPAPYNRGPTIYAYPLN